jgi:hypothetical protein
MNLAGFDSQADTAAHTHAAQALAIHAHEGLANACARENARTSRELRSTRCRAQARTLAAAHGCQRTACARKRERNNAILKCTALTKLAVRGGANMYESGRFQNAEDDGLG